jgi:hypothetical protein
MSKEAMKLALEALEICSVRQEHQWHGLQKMQMAKHALREALAQERSSDEPPAPVPEAHEQEPVAWRVRCTEPQREWVLMYKRPTTELQFSNMEIQPLYTSPPAQRIWVGLSDEEIAQGNKESWVTEQAWQSAVWWAEAKLKEKNT